MAYKLFLLFAMAVTLATGQRPGFAGSRPIGYPDVYNRTTTTAAGLNDRFGEDDATTQRLPIEANGDRELVDRLSKLPIDKQPFWFINWQALEANRNKPQTYPQASNQFIDTIPNTGTSNTGTNQFPNSNAVKSPELPVANPSGSNQVENSGSNLNLVENRFSDTEPTSSVSTTVEAKQESSTKKIESSTRLFEINGTVHLPTHHRFRPKWRTTTFNPRTPVIDN